MSGRCDGCNESLDWIKSRQVTEHYDKVYLSNGLIATEHLENYDPRGGSLDYICPECGHVFGDFDEDDIISFLLGEYE